MSERAQALAAKLEEVNDELAGVIEGLTDQQWQSQTTEEGWTVAAAAHHVAVSHEGVAGMVMAVANGQALPPITMDDLNGMNAQHAREYATCDRAESVALLRKGGADAAGLVRGLSDEQLGRQGVVVGMTMTAQQLIENILINHVTSHGASIRSAVS
jgi:uncharacterized protein (TIGR03083 family)